MSKKESFFAPKITDAHRKIFIAMVESWAMKQQNGSNQIDIDGYRFSISWTTKIIPDGLMLSHKITGITEVGIDEKALTATDTHGLSVSKGAGVEAEATAYKAGTSGEAAAGHDTHGLSGGGEAAAGAGAAHEVLTTGGSAVGCDIYAE